MTDNLMGIAQQSTTEGKLLGKGGGGEGGEGQYRAIEDRDL